MPYRMVKGPHGSRVRQWYSEKKLGKAARERMRRDYAIQYELQNKTNG